MSEFVQLHLLTSYPPANLNRDDLGRPKTAQFGGVQRLRISSQSLKRAWRTSEVFHKQVGDHVGKRTKSVGVEVSRLLVAQKVEPALAQEVARKIAEQFGKLKREEAGAEGKGKSKGKGKAAATEGQPAEAKFIAEDPELGETEQLAHISALEWKKIQGIVQRVAKGELKADALDTEVKELVSPGLGSADIALFGRMLAAKPEFNVDAAAQVAHAITVHKAAVEDDFFSAVDDLNPGTEDRGAGHLGTTEFGAGLFYLYVNINRSLLLKNLGEDRALALATTRALIEAACTVSPSGKQNSFGSLARASYVLAEVGDQTPRNLSVAFLKPVQDADPLKEAMHSLEQTRAAFDKAYGPCAKRHQSFHTHGDGHGALSSLLDFVAKE
jgi:CRISPR system Cascade subunit CasC